MDRPLTGDNDRDLHDIVEGTSQNGEDMLNELEELQLRNALWKVVDSLPEIERNVIKARYQNNMTLKECGRVTGTGIGRFANTWTSATERVALGIESSFRE